MEGRRWPEWGGASPAAFDAGRSVSGSWPTWPLMLVLLLVGMMNLVWMAVIAGVIFAEKVVPRGVVVSKVLGWGLAGWGIILLTAPHTVPALGGV
ncbi:MAG: hypothetical protein NVS4B2_28080 [Chloroflexota bacterium]